jgi:3-phenylpropionate/cinnamic acid dioxygenase small subunit
MSLRDEIENVLYRYAWCYDMNELDSIGPCFMPDAEVAFLKVRVVGLDAVLAELRRRRDRYSDDVIPFHAMMNVYLRERRGNEVDVTSMYMFTATRPGDDPILTSIGYYRDRFDHDGEAWRIARRQIVQRPDPTS